MVKKRTVYICNICGTESVQWFGKCESCQTYGTLEERIVVVSSSSENTLRREKTSYSGKENCSRTMPKPKISNCFDEIMENGKMQFQSGYGELDRVLGGGVVPGSLVLIGGDPGIGKSTLLLQVANKLAQKLPRILYISAEESAQQIKLRASRLMILDTEEANKNLFILSETNLEEILGELKSLQPQVAIIDSIQTLYLSTLSSAPGSVSQVKECTSVLMRLAKRDNITLLIVGHVTKEGTIAGPRVLEHLVDTVLYFEGDRYASHRLLRSVKNRFGATHEIGIFEMIENGLIEVKNPSELFMGNQNDIVPGTAIVVTCEGTRPLVVELQALISPTSYPSPRRSTTGIEYSRLQQILAVLEKRVGIPLSKLDVYVSSTGGLGVEEPAADLGIAIAIVASVKDRIIIPSTILIGEIGLSGQVRSVSQIELRLKEAVKLGFTRAIVPNNKNYNSNTNLEIIPVGKLTDAISAALLPQK